LFLNSSSFSQLYAKSFITADLLKKQYCGKIENGQEKVFYFQRRIVKI